MGSSLAGDTDLFAFIQVADPTKVKVRERKCAEGEAKLLDFTVGCVVPLLPVAPARADSELEASVDRLFDEGGSADQGDSAASGGQETETKLVMRVRIVADENVVAEKPKRPRKKRQAVMDASGFSHLPKKLRGDHEISSGVAIGGKSPSILKELLASSMLNVEAGVQAVATLPLVTSSASVTLEHESSVPTNSIDGINLHTIGASERFIISSDSSHNFSTNAFGAEADSIIRSAIIPPVMTEAMLTSHAVNAPSVLVPESGTKVPSPVHASMFHDSDSTETIKADIAGPSYSTKEDLSMGSHELNFETLHQIRKIDYHHLFTEFNVGTARQACLNVEVRMRTEYYLSKRKRLESECEKQANLLKVRDKEVENLKARLLLKETEAAEAAHFRVQVAGAEATKKMHVDEIDALKQRNVLKDLNVVVSSLRSQKDSLADQVSGYEQLKEQIKEFQDAQMNIVNDKVAMLDAGLLEIALHLEEKFYPRLLTTRSSRRWLLTYGLKLAVVKCLNSQEYLSALGAAISRAIKKGMQDGLSAGIDHEKEGRSLANIVTYNPAMEVDYNSALQRLDEVEFPLLAKLKSHKDASTADAMNLLRLEGPLADAPRMSKLQPDVEQLTLLIHHPEDQVVLGDTSLSFALSVTHSRVKRIRENVAAQRLALIDVWVPLVDPLSAKSLICEASTFGSMSAAVVTTTALSTTFAAASSVPPITIEDYEIVGTDGPEDAQGNGQGNVASFPTIEFEKEKLDTTPECDPPS
uniref:Transposase (Putative), gypsy type n=1 Tax=Tanacetum cinerariifolium TaxID=118510 RepID=A0A6L2JM45_TANCI|nr:hypothetical protein [Tanacetum cinerariifolium]